MSPKVISSSASGLNVRLGMSPISWSNDDLPQLGGETSLETCLIETRQAGYTGTETGGKFPSNADELVSVLTSHDLALVSGWYSGTMISNDIESEKRRITPQLELFRDVGAAVIVYGETFETVQNQQSRALSSRPKLADFDAVAYGRNLTLLAEYCADYGVPLTLHHHMGTAVESEAEIDTMMNNTGEAVNLLLDTGHLIFAGGDNASVISKYGSRINHVHTKDIRPDILAGIDREEKSFLDCVLDGVFTVPGDGMIDYHDVMQRLADVGYEGWVIVEAEQDPVKANPLIYAKKGYNALMEALTAAGYGVTY